MEIPVNTTAEIRLADAGEILADGGLSFEATQEGPRALTGSGTYVISFLRKQE